MSRVVALGTFHTAIGDWLIFPCGCDKENLDPNRHKAVSVKSLTGGSYPKPVWTNFAVDYVYEERPIEVTIQE